MFLKGRAAFQAAGVCVVQRPRPAARRAAVLEFAWRLLDRPAPSSDPVADLGKGVPPARQTAAMAKIMCCCAGADLSPPAPLALPDIEGRQAPAGCAFT